MITDYSRDGWFGASDTKFVMRDNHDTKSWQDFWDEKCGRTKLDVSTIGINTGTAFEHPKMDSIDGGITKDRQIVLRDMRLRVNYDCDKDGIIYEVKTNKAEKPFLTKNALYQFIPKHIFGQVQVQMYVWKTAHELGMDVPRFKKLYVVEYPLYGDDYIGNPEVDFKRIKFHKVTYDKGFIKEYEKRLKPLADRMMEEWHGEET